MLEPPRAHGPLEVYHEEANKMAQHIDSTIIVELLPKGDSGDLRLDAFLEELEALKIALRETERLASGREPSLYFTIKRLTKNSPAVIELEATSTAEDERSKPQFASHVVRNLTGNLRVIGTRVRPRKMDMATMIAYEDLTKPLVRHGLQVLVKSGKNSVRINQDFKDAIRAVMGEDEVSYGSISGRIEGMTTHSRNVFRLYPIVGPSRVLGFFTKRKRAKFTAGMDKYVTVWGTVKYKTWDNYPYEINAEDIEVHDETPAPSLLDMRGMAPQATGVLTARDFVDDLRDE